MQHMMYMYVRLFIIVHKLECTELQSELECSIGEFKLKMLKYNIII